MSALITMDTQLNGMLLVSGKLIFLAVVLLISLFANLVWLAVYLKNKHQKEKYTKVGTHPSHNGFNDIKFRTWLVKHLPRWIQPKSVKSHPHRSYSSKDNLLVLMFHPYFKVIRKVIALWMIFVLTLGSTGIYALIKSPSAKASGDFSIKTGYYYGNGTTLSVTGLGFAPETIIIKSDTAAGSMVWKSTAMPTAVTAYMGVATADNTETEITLGADGFSVSAATEVNSVNVRYIYIAYAGSDCTAGGVLCIGSYTGDGASTKAVTTGFQPNLVWVKRTTAVAANFRTSSMSDNHAALFSATANDTTGTYFTTLNATGFTVGTTNNTNGGLYYYVAFKTLANKLFVSSFVGDGLDSKNITGVGFEPDFVFVKQNAALAPAFSTTEMWGDLSDMSTAVAIAVNNIQSLDSDGFQVGTSTSVNASGITSHYFAFGGSADPAPSGSFYMKKGSYTGNGTSQSIDTTFAPDLVFIKGNTTEYGVWSTSMDYNITHYFANSAVGFANGVTSMSTSGFTVGTSTTVNTNGITYEYIAFGNATSPHKGSRASDFAIGTYTGNGLSPRSIDHLGFNPSMVVIKRPITTAALSIWGSTAMAANTSEYFSATADVTDGTTIRSFDTGGFTVGTGATANTVNVTYTWFAFKEGSYFDVGSHTGTGVAKNVTGLGFNPDYVWTKRSTAVSAIHRSTSSTITTTLSQYFLNLSNITNFITAFVTDGFTVGTATEVNANTGAYQYAAWKSSGSSNPPATPTNSAPSNSATAQDLNPTLTGSAYSDPDGSTQTDSQWQVDNDSDFSSPVWSRTAGATGVTTSVTSGNGTFANELAGKTVLDHNTTYYFRVRYSDGIWGSWSTGTSFTTNTISTPTNSTPANLGSVTTLTPTLSSTDFSDAQAGHTTGTYAEWQISTSSSFSSQVYDSGEVAYGSSLVVPAATLANNSVYYWRVKYGDVNGQWSSYSTATRFSVSISTGPAVIVKPAFGQVVVDQGDSVKIDTQITAASGAVINNATVTIDIYSPDGTKVVTGQSMSYVASSNGLYRYAYTIPSTSGSYLYSVTAISGSDTGYGAANFEVRTISASLATLTTNLSTVSTNLNTVSTNVSTINTNLSSLSATVANIVSEVGTGNISSIKTKTDTISWSDVTGLITSAGLIKAKTDNIAWSDVTGIKTKTDAVNWSDIASIITEIGTGDIAAIRTNTGSINWTDITGIVTSNGLIKAKTDTINWSDVTAIKTKTDTISWGDVTGIKSKTDTIEWSDITTIKNSSVGTTGTVIDTDPTDSSFKTSLTAAKNDFYKNMVITFMSGNNSGQSRRISGYAFESKTIHVDPALSYTPANGDSFVISIGSVRAEELAGNAKSVVESVQSKLNSLSGTLPSDYSGMYDQLKAIAASLSGLGVITGSGADSLYSLSSASKDDITYLKNKLLDLQAALEINKVMLSGGNQNSVVSTWYTFHSVVLNMLIANPTSREAVIPFKAYLPKEAKPENIISAGGLKVEFDEGAQSYFVTGEFNLKSKESVTKQVEIKDIWQINEDELNGFKTQATDLYTEAQKTSYSAQALVLKNDVNNLVTKILRKQTENTGNPAEHIQTFRENQDDLASVKDDLKKLTDLVTSAGAGRGLLASVGGIQTISTWGIVVALIAGLVVLGAFSYTMWKHEMMVVAAITGKLGTDKENLPMDGPDEAILTKLQKPALNFSLPKINVNPNVVAWIIIVTLLLGIGYFLIKLNVFNLGASVPTPSSMPSPQPTATPVPVKKITIKETGTGWLRVRADASTESDILDKVDVGETFSELDRKMGDKGVEWIKIRTAKGLDGWVLASFTE